MPWPSETLGLYISVPFCRAKCTFCNFASGVGTPEAVERYVALLCREIRAVREAAEAADIVLPERVDTVYIGGGTPSLLQASQLEAIFVALRGEFQIEDGAEMTLEAAPGQIGAGLLDRALRMGVNRVSLGVQTFVDAEAAAVGRSHTERSCLGEFARLRAAGVRSLGVDLIAGLPRQTEQSWAQSLEVAAGCGLDHLSVYMLEVDEESRLGREVLGGGARLQAPAVPTDDSIAAMYEMACEQLPARGFAQYEISNFAGKGARSRHNVKYWQREPYLGLGMDAHSMAEGQTGTGLRWANADELAVYEGVSAMGTAEPVTDRQAFEETVFLGLRLAEGLRRDALEHLPASWRRAFQAGVEHLESAGLLHADDLGWRLSRRGQVVSTEVFGELLAGLPCPDEFHDEFDDEFDDAAGAGSMSPGLPHGV